MHVKSDKELAQIIWDYMRYEQPPEKADMIVGLGSADERTADHCAKLYYEGYAPGIIFSGGRGKLTKGIFNEPEAEVYARRALALGVPSDAIIKEPQADSTGQNVVNIYQTFQKNNLTPKKLILVTKPYMLRRAYATFMKQWPSTDIPQIIMSAINLTMEQYTTNSYITLEHMTHIMVGDLQCIKEYPKLGFQIAQEIPAETWSAYEVLVQRGYTQHLLKDV